MNTFVIDGMPCTSVELKEMLVSRGLNVCTERDIWRLAYGIELDW